jgi:beta-lactamase regulating signal transducer with metallopeptidase domain
MNELLAFFDLPWTQALGWTLLHSLWQGILIALLWRLLILTRTDAQSRYNFSVLALLTLALAVGFTFFWQLHQTETNFLPIAGGTGVAGVVPEIPFTPEEGSEVFSWQQFVQSWTLRVQHYLPYLVMLWLLGATFLGFRLTGGWFYLKYLRQRQVRPLPAEWQRQVQRFAGQMGIGRKVQILESRLIEHPLTLGHFKPVILIPLGMLSGLSPEQIEALIRHELAHIRRADYLVNLLQSCIETVLFFHPAVWWISGQIRESREHCCDDLALQQGQDRWEYAQALLQLNKQTVTFKSPLAMSALGNKHSQLTRRIQRLFGPPRTEHLFTRMMVLALLLSGSLLTWAFNPSMHSPQASPSVQEWAQSLAKTIRITPQSSGADLKNLQSQLEPFGLVIESITEIKGQGIVEFAVSKPNSDNGYPIAITDFSHIDFIFPENVNENVEIKTDGVISVEWESPFAADEIEVLTKEGKGSYSVNKNSLSQDKKEAPFFPTRFDPQNAPLIAIGGKLLDPQPAGGIKGYFEENNIKPDQVESMNICKGSEAIEKFGSGAQNGVMDFYFKPGLDFPAEAQEASPLVAIEGKLLDPQPQKGTDGLLEEYGIEPDQIKAINVWKGEKAVEKFGQQAENGVVDIYLKPGVEVTVQAQAIPTKISINGKLLDPQPAMSPDAFLEKNGIEPEMIATIDVWKAKNGEDVVNINLKPGLSLPSQSQTNEFYFDNQFPNPKLRVFPNPGQEQIKTEFQLEKEAAVKLSVYDLNGREIQVLSEQTLAPGSHRFEWQAKEFASGTYLIRLAVGGKIWQEKVILK